MTGVNANVSSSSEHFPGTELRVIQITAANAAQVSKATAVILEVHIITFL